MMHNRLAALLITLFNLSGLFINRWRHSI